MPGLSAHAAPGHTPGHLVFVIEGAEHDVIFTGDAIKNRAELLSRTADMTYNQSLSGRSMETIWDLWRKRAGSVMVPGHDMPMMLTEGEPRYLGTREGGIAARAGDEHLAHAARRPDDPDACRHVRVPPMSSRAFSRAGRPTIP
jgi:glyoxylase-like metal-dependent hydrolase (beta-lactamase superfamily II)